MGDIIGVDQSQAVLALVKQRLSEKGVIAISEPSAGGYVINAQGMANKRRASFNLEAPHDLSTEQVSDKADEVVRFIEDAIRQGGEPEMDSKNQNA